MQVFDTQSVVGNAHRLYSTNVYRWTGAVEQDVQSAILQMCANAMQHLWDIMGVPLVLFWCVVVVPQYGASSFHYSKSIEV